MGAWDRDSARSAGLIRPRSHPNVCATASHTVPRTTKPTTSLQGHADALSCRRSRSGPSFATKTKCSARSDSVCEHRDSRAGGAAAAAIFPSGGREQQATRGRGTDAQGAARHRAQRGRIVRNAPAHLPGRDARLELAVADAEQHAHLESTAITITMKAATLTLSEVSAGLPTSMDARGRARHALSVELAAARLRWQPRKNGSSRCRLDRDIAATARCRVFDSRVEPGGEG